MRVIFVYLILFSLFSLGVDLPETKANQRIRVALSKIESLEANIPNLKVETYSNGKGSIEIIGTSLSDLDKDLEDKKLSLVMDPHGENKSSSILIRIPSNDLVLKFYSEKIGLKLEGTKAKSIHVFTRTLDMELVDTEFAVQVNTFNGSYKVISHKGNQEINAFSLETDIAKSEGDLFLENFSKAAKIREHVGHLSLKLNGGELDVENGEGNIQFENQEAKLRIVRQDGKVKGQNVSGLLNLRLGSKSRYSIRSDDGDVNVYVGGDSGAWVNIGSTEGDLYHPSYLEQQRLPSLKLTRGRLRGSTGGSLFVRTKKSNVKVLLK